MELVLERLPRRKQHSYLNIILHKISKRTMKCHSVTNLCKMKQYNLLKYIKLLKYTFHTLKYFNVLPRYIHIIIAYIISYWLFTSFLIGCLQPFNRSINSLRNYNRLCKYIQSNYVWTVNSKTLFTTSLFHVYTTTHVQCAWSNY